MSVHRAAPRLGAGAGNLVHPVEAAQHVAFAPRWTDDGGHLSVEESDVDTAHGAVAP
jgi:hypothetical protein